MSQNSPQLTLYRQNRLNGFRVLNSKSPWETQSSGKQIDETIWRYVGTGLIIQKSESEEETFYSSDLRRLREI